ncbi:MAG TPA: glutathione S-transferase family protein [Steroidobacteraceae bacterium]|nr:glutathione S-transferase family protein [Steroidobacteraceae bacterium]
MSLTLYHGEPNGPSLTVLAALFAKQVPADLRYVDLARGERHALPCAQEPLVAMSIEGEGPVLVADGEAMSDSVFIACYLDDLGQGAALRPPDAYDRWETMKWCRQMIERTAPAAAYLGCHAHPPHADGAMLERIGSVDLRARWEEIGARQFSAEQLADSRSKIRQAAERIEARLAGREWLMGDYSIADLESFAWLAGMVPLVPEAFADRPRLRDWLARVKASQAVAKALSLARSPEPAASWSVGPEINRWG